MRDVKFELEEIFNKNIAKYIFVDIALANRSFSIIGEGVSKRIAMPHDKITIFQTLAMAGDLLSFGVNKLEINRGLTSSSTAVFIPFTTEELFINSSNSLYYGLNVLSHNLIMADRKKLKNPNGLILGTPGSGKSFSAKREMANAILVTDDDA